ncbi:sodium-coupled monocarboxylate transporter 1-like [Mizuhopecten yessoensis]|uniref:Sodium-coupled monocarboxylate transporter 1 n=1 Tax=Mizuhopecten yessoensis TaxID=6573 RepID=A0A210PTW9_MIZYE|nr:sodium-coupled monocarboxylate transporter 1-like [Mizuhopecten yessoensis]OWF39949.1 Sodium-coupled monocarboxylate transporter 1 [Mizuhopecten yessoensis]
MDVITEASLKTCKKVCELCDGEQIGSFVAVDYVLFAAVLVVSALIGVFYMVKEYRATKQATAEDVLMGGRDIGIFPIAMSLMASFMSAITVLGTPTEMYNNNTSYWIAGNVIIITTILTNHVFLPFFHNLNLTSAYEYLEKRFNVVVRVCASAIFMLNMLLYMGVVLYAPALALNQVTGLSLSLSIVCIGLVCTFYTALGGLRAVVWTDTFQTFVVMAGLIAIIVVGSREVGGLDKVWKIADHGGRIHFFDWSADPTVRHSFWALVIGSVVGQLTIYAANQTMIQRYLAIKEITNSKKALYVSLPLTLILSTVVCLVGLVIYATYHDCDPKLLNLVKARDQLLPFLVMDKLTFLPGLPGLFVASLFSASLSSISSGLNALAIVILEDVFKIYWRYHGKEPSPIIQGRLAKVLGFVCGGMVIGIAFLSQFLGQTVLQIMLSIFGMVGGPLLGLFLNGIFIPWVNTAGALCGLICSAFLTFWVAIGGSIILPVPPIKNVSTSICQHFQRNCTTPANNQNMSAIYSTVPSISTTYYNTSSITQTATTPNGQDLWIYHISYLWYALFAVLISIVVGIIVTFVSTFCFDLNRPEDIEKELVHPIADRVCCYPSISCQKVHRLSKKPAEYYETSLKKYNGHENLDVGHDGPYTVTNGDLELKSKLRERTQRRNGNTSRTWNDPNPSYYENNLMPDDDDALTKL